MPTTDFDLARSARWSQKRLLWAFRIVIDTADVEHVFAGGMLRHKFYAMVFVRNALAKTTGIGPAYVEAQSVLARLGDG
jgi:hypothetical protein